MNVEKPRSVPIVSTVFIPACGVNVNCVLVVVLVLVVVEHGVKSPGASPRG
jgi:hypothetical protein